MIRFAAAIVLIAGCLPLQAPAQLPSAAGVTMAPDEWLLSSGQPWHHRTQVAPTPAPLTRRAATADEAGVVDDAARLFERSPARAMALVDGNAIVWSAFKAPAGERSRLLSFSVGKTVTAMAVGKAICDGKLSFDTVATAWVPELKGTDLGAATVRDLLAMSSGTWKGNPDSTIHTSDELAAVHAGKMSYVDILASPRVSSAHTGVLGGKRKPGETFAYRSTDPQLLGVLVNRATGTPYARWVESQVLLPAGIETPAIIGQDRFGYGNAEGNVRLTLDDWVRFAVWVKEAESAAGCFGDFVRAATRTQIPNTWKEFGKLFDGYGYLIWTDNLRLRDSYWAVGHGGQRIGWNHRNRRMLVAFSNLESYMDELYTLYRAWAALP